jgi:hypothetical protein
MTLASGSEAAPATQQPTVDEGRTCFVEPEASRFLD